MLQGAAACLPPLRILARAQRVLDVSTVISGVS